VEWCRKERRQGASVLNVSLFLYVERTSVTVDKVPDVRRYCRRRLIVNDHPACYCEVTLPSCSTNVHSSTTAQEMLLHLTLWSQKGVRPGTVDVERRRQFRTVGSRRWVYDLFHRAFCSFPFFSSFHATSHHHHHHHHHYSRTTISSSQASTYVHRITTSSQHTHRPEQHHAVQQGHASY